ncbi:hypothetical protein BC834DRAFT_130094 [Gloeopeniophorella convolvens]|nr:hypothetical protein BC834DRAFT_130094 [Gloeopeniophorella convolvens]
MFHTLRRNGVQTRSSDQSLTVEGFAEVRVWRMYIILFYSKATPVIKRLYKITASVVGHCKVIINGECYNEKKDTQMKEEMRAIHKARFSVIVWRVCERAALRLRDGSGAGTEQNGGFGVGCLRSGTHRNRRCRRSLGLKGGRVNLGARHRPGEGWGAVQPRWEQLQRVRF